MTGDCPMTTMDRFCCSKCVICAVGKSGLTWSHIQPTVDKEEVAQVKGEKAQEKGEEAQDKAEEKSGDRGEGPETEGMYVCLCSRVNCIICIM